MKDVFISYKAEEFDEANWVKSVLENNGISCWMAPSCIPGGSSYAVEIPHAIRSAKVLVLILSEKAQASPWVSREIDLALNEGKIVLPFMLENCALKDDFNFYLTNVQRYAAYENKAAAMEKMIREIKAIVGANEVSQPETTPDVEEKAENKPTEKTEKFNIETSPKSAKYDVFSILSLVFGAIAILALYGIYIIPDVLAMIFALLGIKNIATKKLKGKVMAIIGLILGCISLIIGLFVLFAAIGAAIGAIISVIFAIIFIIYFKRV